MPRRRKSGRRVDARRRAADRVGRPRAAGDRRRPGVPAGHELAALVRARKVSSVELTQALPGAAASKYDALLKCVVTLTEELALKQAEQADREIAAGRYRGPLHGIPWGAKDLIAYPGYKTTWGAGHFKDQTLDVKATVARRLEEAGAVLVAKLTLGALALGDQWFGGMTRNPVEPRGRLQRLVGRLGVGRRRRAWSASPSAARRWAASSRPAGAAAPPACGRRSAASAGTAA